MRATACTLFLLSLLWDSVRAENSISSLQMAAVSWEGELPCRKWDCECTFKNQRGCCCAATELQEAEDQIFQRVMELSTRIFQLGDSIHEVIGGVRVAFTASMSRRKTCFGPFTRNSPIPYDVITLNHGSGYNPTLGTFTAPRSGLYSFALSVYSKVGGEGEKMYYKVQLMRNGEVVASTWEDNREDSEDSSTQTVLLSVEQGGQVYVELLSGRQLCGNVEGLNTFSGSLVYPSLP
ncbi:complement C1q-like protein 4 [Labrus mixtus]|uniref:complement C1q-like protein 4 n=1 Tax=Labrus mixtus TaxID=508554 RepID=UPI0029C03927|nr:complement C1q-like protein 4 [Labrus mixtus]XP_060908886.1 complement C1q-like protein 4 [Labrus mixtus]XP_060908887.1 complement C1q-like protein 4 [Labrus mixtus]